MTFGDTTQPGQDEDDESVNPSVVRVMAQKNTGCPCVAQPVFSGGGGNHENFCFHEIQMNHKLKLGNALCRITALMAFFLSEHLSAPSETGTTVSFRMAFSVE
jgi:hypothetical protein